MSCSTIERSDLTSFACLLPVKDYELTNLLKRLPVRAHIIRVGGLWPLALKERYAADDEKWILERGVHITYLLPRPPSPDALHDVHPVVRTHAIALSDHGEMVSALRKKTLGDFKTPLPGRLRCFYQSAALQLFWSPWQTMTFAIFPPERLFEGAEGKIIGFCTMQLPVRLRFSMQIPELATYAYRDAFKAMPELSYLPNL